MPFQFLIGSMKAFFKIDRVCPCRKFQFLIGSMKVGDEKIVWRSKKHSEFQFLIGSMKAGIPSISPYPTYSVSIPYRFNESQIKHILIYHFSVSIPYRFNESSTFVQCNLMISMFQFLIGSMKDHSSRIYATSEYTFQFLIGSMKAFVGLLVFWILLFQFLIGSMKGYLIFAGI